MGSISIIFIVLFFVYQWYGFCSAQLAVIPMPDGLERSETAKDFVKDYKEAKKKHTLENREMDDEYDHEYDYEPPRRSFLKKMKLESDRLVLEKWLTVLEQQDDAKILEVLDELEFLLHEFELANEFMNMNGFKTLFKLINHENPSYSSAALSVLISAMQGNPNVQSYIEQFNIIGLFIKAVESKSELLSKYITVVSCYMRNVPFHQLEFIHRHGLHLLTEILKDFSLPEHYKYKVIDLLGDLATELFDKESEDYKTEREVIGSYFAWNANVSRICEEIPSYLQFDGFDFQERVVVAMNALFDVCMDSFKKEYVIKIVQDVKSFYTEQNWYSFLDYELKSSIVDDLNKLLKKIHSKHEKDEL